jgi:hypothetical protein
MLDMSPIIQALQNNLNQDNLFTIAVKESGLVIDFNLLNEDFWTILRKNNVKYLQSVYIQVDEAKKVARVWNEWRTVEWSDGRPFFSVSFGKSFNKGTFYVSRKTNIYKITLQGLEKTYSLNMNTFDIIKQIRFSIKQAGYKLVLDKYTKFGLIIGLGTLISMLLCFGFLGIITLLG